MGTKYALVYKLPNMELLSIIDGGESRCVFKRDNCGTDTPGHPNARQSTIKGMLDKMKCSRKIISHWGKKA